MDERKLKILNSIIKSYIESAEPVGSRTLSKDEQIGVSAATIRNEMSDLEELGYLEKVHSSSGRIPSNRAYRLYVNALLADQIPFRKKVPELFDMRRIEESNEFENIISNATTMLSAITNYTAVGLVPGMADVYLKHIDVVYLTPRDLVINYIYNSKAVKNDVVRLKIPTSFEKIDIVNRVLKSTLVDMRLEDIIDIVHTDMYKILAAQHEVLHEIIPIIERTSRDGLEAKVIYEGLGNLYIFSDVTLEENQELIRYLKDENPLKELLASNMETDLQIYIGEEIGIKDLAQHSIITATYRNMEGLKGKIGVIGPNRMDYEKVISDLAIVTKYINGNINRNV